MPKPGKPGGVSVRCCALAQLTDTFVGLSLPEAINSVVLQALLFVGRMGFAILKFPYLAGADDFFF